MPLSHVLQCSLGGETMTNYTNYLIENKHFKTLNILTLGHQICEPLHSFSYAHTNFYLIHYVVSGKGTFIKNKKKTTVSKGQMFIIKPDNVYTYTADENDPWEYIWFSFDGELSGIFEGFGDVLENDGTIITEMLEAANLKNTRAEFLTGKLYEFISSLLEDKPSKPDYVKTVSDFIKANYTDKIYVSDIAHAINLNSRYLTRIFKEKKGVSIQSYILNLKIKKAQSLLKKGFNVSEAAKAVGYDDVFTFSKIFKKYTGNSPSAYKSKNENLNI